MIPATNMTKPKLILICIGVLVVALLVATLLILNSGRAGEDTSDATFGNGEPVSPPPPPSLSITTYSGDTVATRNFLDDPSVTEDSVNPGYYYLGNQPQGTSTPYLIEYIKETDYFNIELLEEPIGETRKSAEDDLRSRLGLSDSELCALDYVVSTPTSVNSTYASINLGFSFCSGAVTLPE